MQRFYLWQKGSAISEYGLAFAGIAVVCIAALAFSGQVFRGAINDMIGPTQAKPAIIKTEPDTENSGNNTTGMAAQKIILGDGSSILLENYASNLAQSIETSGANGATEALLANIESIAKQLIAQNKITAAEYDQMMALVKQGRLIAAAEKAVGDTIKRSNYDRDALERAQILFNGKPYTVSELASQFGYVGPESGSASVEPMLAAYLDIRQKTLKGITDPILKQTVAMLSDQVASVANSYESAVMFAVKNGGLLQNTLQYTADTGSPYMLTELYRNGIVSTDPSNAAIPASEIMPEPRR